MDEAAVKRAGLDYWDEVDLTLHENWEAFLKSRQNRPGRIFALSRHAERLYTSVDFERSDLFLFGPETKGLPASIMEALPRDQCLRIPVSGRCRSLNLANAVAIVIYEAIRQLDSTERAG